MSIGLLFSAATGCKKALDFINNVKGAPDEAVHLWRFVDAIQAPLSLCIRLQNRSLTYPLVQPAILMTQETLLLVNQLLQADSEDPEDSRPNGKESWGRWWKRVPSEAKENIERMNLVPKYRAKLQECLVAMQAALQTVQMTFAHLASTGTLGGLQPLVFEFRAYERAKRIVELFEMGRLETCGNQYQLCGGALATTLPEGKRMLEGLGKGKASPPPKRTPAGALDAVPDSSWEVLTDIGAVVLRQKETEKVYELVFLDAENADEEDDDDEKGHSPAKGAKEKAVTLTPIGVFPLSGGLLGKSTVSEELLQVGATKVAGSGIQVNLNNEWRIGFTSCSRADEFCDFPSGSEAYFPVTIEVFQALLFLLNEIGRFSTSSKGKSVAALAEVLHGPNLKDEAGFALKGQNAVWVSS
jgi:hypothetical protein